MFACVRVCVCAPQPRWPPQRSEWGNQPCWRHYHLRRSVHGREGTLPLCIGYCWHLVVVRVNSSGDKGVFQTICIVWISYFSLPLPLSLSFPLSHTHPHTHTHTHTSTSSHTGATLFSCNRVQISIKTITKSKVLSQKKHTHSNNPLHIFRSNQFCVTWIRDRLEPHSMKGPLVDDSKMIISAKKYYN